MNRQEYDDEYEYEDDEYEDYNPVMYHSFPRIIATTIMLAVIVAIGITIGMEHFTVDANSKRKLFETGISSYLPLGISLIVILCFLRYLFKSTERLLHE